MSPEDQIATPPAAKRPGRLFTRQANMLRVLYALIPLALTGVYFFGWRVAAVLATAYAAGLATELVTTRVRGKPISMACLVTCGLYGLSLPPTVGFGVAACGAVVAILFGKEVFGGFGRNFANPAIVGRAFVYVCFPTQLTAGFVGSFTGGAGGFVYWSQHSFHQAPEAMAVFADTISQASPMWVYKTVGPEAAAKAVSLMQLLTGDISGQFRTADRMRTLVAGSIGEGCAIAIAAAAIYLLVTRTANWRLMLGGFLGVILTTVLFRHGLGFNAWTPTQTDVAPLAMTLLAGPTMFVLVFMVTDPVSAPKRRPAMYAYGLLIGFLMVLLRWRGIFVAAASFAVLLGNMAAPLLDMAAAAWAGRRAAPAKEAA